MVGNFIRKCFAGQTEFYMSGRSVAYAKRLSSSVGRIILFLLLALNHLIYAQDTAPAAGTSSVLLLRFAPSPRTAGLGEAFTGLANDENALYYNPAGLTNMPSTVLSLNHTEWFEDIRVDDIIAGYKFSGRFSMGLGLVHMWMPGLEAKDELGRSLGSFNVSSSVANLGFSYKLNTAFSMGLAVKYFQDRLGTYTAAGFGFDAGLFLKTAVSGLTAGLVVQNLGKDVTYDQVPQKIPLSYRAGVAYKIYPAHTTLVLDVVKSLDTDVGAHFGVEYVFQEQFSLMAGNKFTPYELFLPSFGIGFHLHEQYHLYYSYANYSDLGGTHRFGFNFDFERPQATIR